METQTCIKCETEKPISEYEWQKNRPNPRKKCKLCRYEERDITEENKKRAAAKKAWYRREYPARIRSSQLKAAYGITLDEYNKMLESQNYECKICGIHADKVTKAFHVDHCHSTGKIRGLLCSNCNIGIGNLQDDIEILKKAIKYLGG